MSENHADPTPSQEEETGLVWQSAVERKRSFSTWGNNSPQRLDEAPPAVDIEFRGETIYFIVVDRFHDALPQNAGARADLNDPSHQSWTKYWGGDLQGILDKLDYLQSLGVTALWLTPLFEQVESASGDECPLHGYWARDFKRINSRWVNDVSETRLFARQDTVFDRLISELHKRGMKLILDIVCNHSSPQTDEGKGRLYDDGRLVADFSNDTEHWYHHYGPVTDWEDDWQVQNCELKGLATFNENNIYYRRHIKEAIKLWLDKGVDALRIDTVKHMPLWFWQEFNSDIQMHKPGVFIFGEWIHSHPDNARSVAFANDAGMSILDFGLCHAIRDCFTRPGTSGFQEVQNILDKDDHYRSSTELVTFFENHDIPRLQSLNADEAWLRLATVLILTARGIPCVYYGSEQYLHDDTNGGEEPYNRPMMVSWSIETELAQLLRVLSSERRRNQAVQWGGHWPLVVEADFYVFLRRYRSDRLLVFLNKGPERICSLGDVAMEDGAYTCLLSGEQMTVVNGTASPLAVPPRSARVFSRVGPPLTAPVLIRVQVNGAPTSPGETVAIIGDCPELGDWDIREAVPLECINRNTWFGEICFSQTCGKPMAYKFVILSAVTDAAPHRENRTTRRRAIPIQGVSRWRDIWEE
ncbi:MAG: hypothetical protein JNN07_17230 [Verrucomicrobiales bacterium]|nr:hypothetical protein [Verrucomicrobiales bacterium]